MGLTANQLTDQPSTSAPQLVTVPAALLERMFEQMAETHAALNRLSDSLDARLVQSPWMSAREAATCLGLDVTKKNYVRKLSWLIRQGFIQNHREGKPRMYDREEIAEVNERILNGEIGYIGQV